MSWDQRLTAEDYRRQAQEANLLGGAMGVAIFLVPVIVLARLGIFLSAAPGRDLTGDGAFSIADVLRGLEYAFNEPAWWALAAIPYSVWQFFEISSWQLPGALVFFVAVICWIAIAAILAFGAYWIGKGFIALGRGASVGIGRVQMKVPSLMPMDIIIIAAVVVIFGGFGISWLVASVTG